MRTTITINHLSQIEYISVYIFFAGGEKHLKFPVIDNIIQDVPIYHQIYPKQLLNDVIAFAQSAIINESYDDIA